MAAANSTPIILYNSGATGNTPLPANLAHGELALNYADGLLFYKDTTNTVQQIGGGGSGTVTSVSGSGGTTGLTLSGGPITSSGTLTLGGTLVVANGGTGATTLTGYVKGSGTSALTASATIPNTDITGLGTMSTQNANSVAITGGAIDGATIGGTSAAAITGTTIIANTAFEATNFDAATSGGGSLRNASGTACFQWGGGGGVNCTVDGPINMNGANATISIAPTGTGTATINPATAGTINNMVIGGTTPAAITGTTITATTGIFGGTF